MKWLVLFELFEIRRYIWNIRLTLEGYDDSSRWVGASTSVQQAISQIRESARAEDEDGYPPS